MNAPEIKSLVIPCGTYFKPVLGGDPCKAVRPYKERRMVEWVVDAFREHVDNIVLAGPHEKLRGINNVEVIDEESVSYRGMLEEYGLSPDTLNYEMEWQRLKSIQDSFGLSFLNKYFKWDVQKKKGKNDSYRMLRNVLNAVHFLKHNSDSPWVYVTGCDIPHLDSEKIGQNIETIEAKMNADYNEDKQFCDFYFTVADYSNERYPGIDDLFHIPFILGENMQVREGTMHVLNYQNVLPGLDLFIEMYEKRKIAGHFIQAARYFSRLLGKEGIHQLVNAGLNELERRKRKKVGLLGKGLSLFDEKEYKDVSLDVMIERFSKFFGFKAGYVIVPWGSDDIDVEEHFVAKERCD